MNKQEPTFKIHGDNRRDVKKQYNLIKSCVRTFWHDHHMDNDMNSFYSKTQVVDDDEAKKTYNDLKNKLSIFELLLNEPYKSPAEIRDESINNIFK